MGPIESKSYQLRVRITADERDHLEKLRMQRGRGETISDLVREAIAQIGQAGAGLSSALSPKTRDQVDRLAVLLKREPAQVEEACVEGIHPHGAEFLCAGELGERQEQDAKKATNGGHRAPVLTTRRSLSQTLRYCSLFREGRLLSPIVIVVRSQDSARSLAGGGWDLRIA